MVFTQLEEIRRTIDSVKEKGFDPIVIIELPDSCEYWKSNSLNRFTEDFGMRSEVVHGCAFGLTAQFGKF